MIPRRDQFNGDANQQTCRMRITTVPGSNLVALAGRGGMAAPVIPGLVELPAVATERIAGVFKVIHCKRQTSLLTST